MQAAEDEKEPRRERGGGDDMKRVDATQAISRRPTRAAKQSPRPEGLASCTKAIVTKRLLVLRSLQGSG